VVEWSDVFILDNDDDEETTFVETRKGLSRKAIEQLGFIKDINSLVVLSGSSYSQVERIGFLTWSPESLLTLYPLPDLAPATPLTKTKSAFSFALNTSVRQLLPDGSAERPREEGSEQPKPIPTLVTHLVVGCRRIAVIYSWKDGEPQETKVSKSNLFFFFTFSP
jgi:hypothetical protein